MTTFKHPGQAPSLYTPTSEPKYTNEDQQRAFIQACYTFPPKECSFGLILGYTGMRITEARSLTAMSLQYTTYGAVLVFQTLKQKNEKVRSVLIPDHLAARLEEVHRLDELRKDPEQAQNILLYSWSRTHAWKVVKRIIQKAGITGACAVPHGLRHGFANSALAAGASLVFIQKALGHASLETTKIYLELAGKEEREVAERIWQRLEGVPGPEDVVAIESPYMSSRDYPTYVVYVTMASNLLVLVMMVLLVVG